jgi:hypothetical protein
MQPPEFTLSSSQAIRWKIRHSAQVNWYMPTEASLGKNATIGSAPRQEVPTDLRPDDEHIVKAFVPVLWPVTNTIYPDSNQQTRWESLLKSYAKQRQSATPWSPSKRTIDTWYGASRKVTGWGSQSIVFEAFLVVVLGLNRFCSKKTRLSGLRKDHSDKFGGTLDGYHQWG